MKSSFIYMIVISSSLCSCTAREAVLIKDLIEGEAQVAEKIIEDESGQQRPKVEIVKH